VISIKFLSKKKPTPQHLLISDNGVGFVADWCLKMNTADLMPII